MGRCVIAVKILLRRILWITFFLIFQHTSYAQEMDSSVWSMVNPLDSMQVTSPWGDRVHPIYGTIKHHRGVDLGADFGQPVYAAATGKVIFAGWAQGYGNYIEIDHGGGIVTAYGHNESLIVCEGLEILQGQIIAFAGSSGNSTGPHLHFEIMINGTDVNPAEYLRGLPPSASMEYGILASVAKLNFEADYDFGKPLREAIETIGTTCSEAIKNLKNIIESFILILITIDLAIGASRKILNAQNEDSVISWLIYKVMMYGLLIFFLTNWSNILLNTLKDLFSGLGGLVIGATQEEAAMAISNPMDIVQKGAHIVASIFAQLMNVTGIVSLLTNIGLFIPCLVFGIILTGSFFIIAIQIALAYIEFYVVAVFSFTTFFFSSLKQTRSYAANGINGLFAVSIKLLFFCLFSLMLQVTLQNITVDDFFQTEREADSSVMQPALGQPIITVDDLMAHIRIVESHGDYAADNGDHYGAYQIAYTNWNNWCENYLNDGGLLDQETPAPANQPAGFIYPANPYNQDAVSKYILSGYVTDYGIEGAARAWNQGVSGMQSGGGDAYWAAVSGANPDTGGFIGRPVIAANFLVLFKVTLFVLLFIWIGDKMSSLMMKQFGGTGFRFTNGG